MKLFAVLIVIAICLVMGTQAKFFKTFVRPVFVPAVPVAVVPVAVVGK